MAGQSGLEGFHGIIVNLSDLCSRIELARLASPRQYSHLKPSIKEFMKNRWTKVAAGLEWKVRKAMELLQGIN